MKAVEKRIIIASEYLQFIKILNQFRNSALDLQEIFKTANEYSFMMTSNTDSVFEQHLIEKLKLFEKLYHDLLKSGNCTIEILKKVTFLIRYKM